MIPEELSLWAPYMGDYFRSESWSSLWNSCEEAYRRGSVFPPREELFTALTLTSPERVRVVVLGQDPYHEPGQAHGLAFSVKDGTRLPPSLVNIYKELQDDLCVSPSESGNLTRWAEQGVLLLNTVLTVSAGDANSHKNMGWQAFTDRLLAGTAALSGPVAYVLWGGQAQKKEPLLFPASGPRLVLKAPHPSPLSAYRGFFGSRPFSQINAFLEANGSAPIDW